MITLENISKTYITKSGVVNALSNVHLQVQKCEIFGVIGRSGAGKSTLIRCVNLLERPTSGRVMLDGQDLLSLSKAQLRQARHNIGMVFQHFNLLSSRNAFDNVAFPLELIGKSKREIKHSVQVLLDLVGLTDRAQWYPDQLSGGQKQRVAIARALATQPRVLLCDEMTSALDPDSTTAILELIQRIHAELQLTILLITHEMEVIKTIADRVAVLDKGRIVECRDVVNLFKNPENEVTKSFVQSTMKFTLPTAMQKQLQNVYFENASVLLKIQFIGKTAAEPIINELVKHHVISANILYANLSMLHHDMIGVMVLSISGKQSALEKAHEFLQQHDLGVEVVGYVKLDVE